MSELSGIRQIKKLNAKAQRAYCRADTVIMSREELDIILSIDAAMAQRDNDRPTVLPPNFSEVG